MTNTQQVRDAILGSSTYLRGLWDYPEERPRWFGELVLKVRYLVGDESLLYVTSDLGRGTELELVLAYTETTVISAALKTIGGESELEVSGWSRRRLVEIQVARVSYSSDEATPTLLQLVLKYEGRPPMTAPIGEFLVGGPSAALAAFAGNLKGDLALEPFE